MAPTVSLQCDLLSPTAYLPQEMAERIYTALADPALPSYQRATLRAISELLDPHEGAANPIPLIEVQRYASAVLGEELPEREVKRAVKLLVEERGIAIGSARGARHGYFFVTTDEEAQMAAEPLLSEIRSLARRCRTLSPRNPYVQHLLGQMEVGV